METERSGAPTKAQLEKINGFARREMKAEEVYVFRAALCDNEVDRDFECFSRDALEKLAPLFVGKTGILDHERTSRGQAARVFAARVEEDGTKTTARGEPYARLIAECYVARTAETAPLIASIESGIRKEVSVGCAVAKRTCSVCGKAACDHVRGRRYGGELCFHILDEPTDAYEFSFVAVPAQRAAGVVKGFSGARKEENGLQQDVMKRLETGTGGLTLSEAEARELSGAVKRLRERAEDGDRYREALAERIRRAGAVAQPELGRELLCAIVKGLSVREMEELAESFTKAAERKMPVQPQLFTEKNAETQADPAFRI